MDTYRSLVDLGSGPKLLGADFTITDPKMPLVRPTSMFAPTSWGDDPYGTLHVDASKSRIYDLRADYRDIAYYNNLPSYADPLLSRGIVLNEQSFDMRRRLDQHLPRFPAGKLVHSLSRLRARLGLGDRRHRFRHRRQ